MDCGNQAWRRWARQSIARKGDADEGVLHVHEDRTITIPQLHFKL
jgi:hypothetical protein